MRPSGRLWWPRDHDRMRRALVDDVLDGHGAAMVVISQHGVVRYSEGARRVDRAISGCGEGRDVTPVAPGREWSQAAPACGSRPPCKSTSWSRSLTKVTRS